MEEGGEPDDSSAGHGDSPGQWPWIAAAVVAGVLLVGGWVIVNTADRDESAQPLPTTRTTSLAPSSSTIPRTEPPSTTSTNPPTTPPPTLPPPAAKTIAQVRDELLAEITAATDPNVLGEITLTCEGSGPVRFGDVVRCRTESWTPEGLRVQGADWVVVIVADDGRWAANGASGPIPWTVPPAGLNCDQLIDRLSLRADQPVHYLYATAYFFLHNQTALMDIDGNGIPCETVFPRTVVDQVWAGGIIREHPL